MSDHLRRPRSTQDYDDESITGQLAIASEILALTSAGCPFSYAFQDALSLAQQECPGGR